MNGPSKCGAVIDASARVPSRDLHPFVTHHILERQRTAHSFGVATDRADLRALDVAALDLRYLPLPDADALGELRLRQSSLLANLTDTLSPHPSEHASLV